MRIRNLIILSLTTISSLAFAELNLSDAIDANETPAEMEQREEEVVNMPDALDRNEVPAALEERAQKEKWRENYNEEQEDMNDQFDQ